MCGKKFEHDSLIPVMGVGLMCRNCYVLDDNKLKGVSGNAMNDGAVTFGKRLKMLRMSQSLTQQNLSDESGIATAVISRIESGNPKYGNLTIQTLQRFSDVLGISVSEMLIGVRGDVKIKTGGV